MAYIRVVPHIGNSNFTRIDIVLQYNTIYNNSPYHSNYDRDYYYIKLIFTLLFNAKAILLSVSILVL